MAKPLSVLFISSEVFPFIKASEYADLCYSHSLGVREVGHDIRVMMPKYGYISERKNRIHEINRLRDIPIAVGAEAHPATVKSSSINNPRVKVQAYITTNQNYLDANKGMYADHATGKEFADNDERFIFFNRTVIETCLLLGWFPDVIHCMGWQAALVPAYIRTMYPQEFKKTRVVFTITDFNDQGAFPWKTFAKTWLPEEVAAIAKHKTKCNFTRIGMHYADRVTTLSPGYANELKANKEFKEHFTPLLHKRALLGIPHGTDMMIWTPKADPHVKPKFDAKDPSNKGAAREALQKMMGLTVDREKMVITYAGRLTEDLGADILLKAIPDLLKDGHQVIVTSDIPPADKKPFEALAKKHPKQMAFMVPLDDEGIHHVLAGSTLLLKPSRSEASGQFQRTCLLYGTIPVVRATGGNAEGLVDADTKGGGNAFLFTKADAADLLKAVGRAVKAHADTETWSAIVATAMNTNVGWALSAKPYDELYRAICKE